MRLLQLSGEELLKPFVVDPDCTVELLKCLDAPEIRKHESHGKGKQREAFSFFRMGSRRVFVGVSMLPQVSARVRECSQAVASVRRWRSRAVGEGSGSAIGVACGRFRCAFSQNVAFVRLRAVLLRTRGAYYALVDKERHTEA